MPGILERMPATSMGEESGQYRGPCGADAWKCYELFGQYRFGVVRRNDEGDSLAHVTQQRDVACWFLDPRASSVESQKASSMETQNDAQVAKEPGEDREVHLSKPEKTQEHQQEENRTRIDYVFVMGGGVGGGRGGGVGIIPNVTLAPLLDLHLYLMLRYMIFTCTGCYATCSCDLLLTCSCCYTTCS